MDWISVDEDRACGRLVKFVNELSPSIQEGEFLG